ncbi:MAG: DUF6449 domain-containing protein [Bacillota bacterium]|nr:DUF6449 domain-containing protein [Bacillota bacterium]
MWILSIAAFVLIFPIYVSLLINRIVSQTEQLTKDFGAAAAGEIVHGKLIEMMQSTLGISFLLFAMTVVLAAGCAVQGFSWLYSRKKIDFYYGMPVKRSKRFLVIWLNGILIYIIPYLIGIVLSMLIAAGNHGMSGSVFKTAMQGLGLHLLLYLCIYHLAIFTVMLTGHVVITGMGFAVLCLYEFVVSQVNYGYCNLFFRYFSGYGIEGNPVFSPISMYIKIADASDGMIADGQLNMIVRMAVFAVVLGVLAYFCYLKRPAEGAGKSMVFGFTKPIIKILMIVPFALLVGLLVSDTVNFYPENSMDGIGYIILALVLTVVLGSAAVQAIYDFDIKGMLRGKSHIVISGVLVALIFLIYRYDLLHYDDYIPEADKVESVAFIPDDYEMVGGYISGYVDTEEGGMYIYDYARKYMYLTDAADVCQLADISMQEYNKYNWNDSDADDGETDCCWSNALVIYRLKNGREVVRNLWVNVEDEQTAKLLDNITGSAEFKEGYMMGASERLDEVLEQEQYTVRAYYGNMIYQHKMSEAELKELLACYRRDMETFSFLKGKESVPVGAVRIELEKVLSESWYGGYSRSSSIMELGMNIYPFFENSISCLKEMGYYMDAQVDIEDIAQIQVVNYNSEAAERLREQQKASAGADTILAEGTEMADTRYNATSVNEVETSVYADYTQSGEIEQIISCTYPVEFLNRRWDNGRAGDDEYDVIIYFKPSSEIAKEYGSSVHYCFVEGEVPEFVQEDTAYKD